MGRGGALEEPAWVAEDCLRLKREAQRARAGKIVRIRAPSPAVRLERRAVRYQEFLEDRRKGLASPVRAGVPTGPAPEENHLDGRRERRFLGGRREAASTLFSSGDIQSPMNTTQKTL